MAVPWAPMAPASGLLISCATPVTSVPMAASRDEVASFSSRARRSVMSMNDPT